MFSQPVDFAGDGLVARKSDEAVSNYATEIRPFAPKIIRDGRSGISRGRVWYDVGEERGARVELLAARKCRRLLVLSGLFTRTPPSTAQTLRRSGSPRSSTSRSAIDVESESSPLGRSCRDPTGLERAGERGCCPRSTGETSLDANIREIVRACWGEKRIELEIESRFVVGIDDYGTKVIRNVSALALKKTGGDAKSDRVTLSC